MEPLNERPKMADMSPEATVGVFIDKVTGYPCQIWQQRTLWGHLPVYRVFYCRKNRWHVASPQFTDRIIRRAGLPGIHDVPWGPGPELLQSMDDQIERAGGAPNMSETLRQNMPEGE